MNELTKNLLIWAVIAFVLIAVFSKFSVPNQPNSQLSYSEFINRVKEKSVKSVQIKGQTIIGKTAEGSTFTTYSPPDDPQLVNDLLSNNVMVEAAPLLHLHRYQ